MEKFCGSRFHKRFQSDLCFLMLALALYAPRLFPQQSSNNIKISGELGAYGELYSIDGRPARRPDNSWNIYFRPTISINRISLPFEFFISSEGEGFRQSINRFTFKPRWGWGGLQTGDVNTSYSQYSLDGVRMRGGAIKLTPGIFRFAAAGGRTQRAVEADSARNSIPAFRRNLYALKIGIGEERSSYMDLNFVKAKDDAESLDSSGAAQPQENLVASLAGQLHLLGSKLRLKGEAAAAAFTRDTGNSEFEVDEIPSFIEDLFTPRLSSRLSSAFYIQANYKERKGGVDVSYRRINPGFVSLGLVYIFDDLEEWKIAPTLRLLQNRWTIRSSFSRRRDNLKDDKRFTTTRLQTRIFSAYRASRHVTVSGGLIVYDMDNNASSDTLRIAQLSRTFTLQPMLNFKTGPATHLLAANYQLQLIANTVGALQSDPDVEIHNLSVNWTLRLPKSLTITPGIIYQDNQNPGAEMRVITYSLGGGYRFWQNKLNAFLQASNTITDNPGNTENTQVGIVGRIDFRPTRNDRLVLSLRNTDFQSGDPLRQEFTETRVSLRYSKSF